MKKPSTLFVIDMQNDFIYGSLANPEAQKLVDPITKLIETWVGNVYVTRDTHGINYLNTPEGKKLPIEHCIEGTTGWCLPGVIMRAALKHGAMFKDKNKFGMDSVPRPEQMHEKIYLVGVCTDICVIVNALMLKDMYPNKQVIVYSNLCAGTTPEKHQAALQVMESCQIDVVEYKEKSE